MILFGSNTEDMVLEARLVCQSSSSSLAFELFHCTITNNNAKNKLQIQDDVCSIPFVYRYGLLA